VFKLTNTVPPAIAVTVTEAMHQRTERGEGGVLGPGSMAL